MAETFGKQGEIKIEVGKQRNGKLKVTFGLVELPPLRARDERLRATPGSPGFTTSKELPLLYKAINEERRRFGLGEIK